MARRVVLLRGVRETGCGSADSEVDLPSSGAALPLLARAAFTHPGLELAEQFQPPPLLLVLRRVQEELHNDDAVSAEISRFSMMHLARC